MSANRIINIIIAALCTLIVGVPVYLLVFSVVTALTIPAIAGGHPVMPTGALLLTVVITLVLSGLLFVFIYKKIRTLK